MILRTLKVIGFSLIFILVATILFTAGINWLALILLFPLYIFGEWVAEKLFTDKSAFNRLSTESVGFSIWRILAAVCATTATLVIVLVLIYGFSSFRQLFGS